MPKTQFYYLPDEYIDPDTKEKLTIYKPVIPIRLQGNRLVKIPVDCLVDSGSDTNLFPAGWGNQAGINFKKGKFKEIIGIGNVKVPAYRCNVTLWVGTRSISTFADFSFSHNIPILGRIDFFKFFPEVIFNENKRYIEIDI
ncbi:MAG: hypothetical protein U1E54_01180 [Candidatus Levybacteria bacterium]|nr:hypothetical protein [Candidatus Levybacteria bacterium]